MTVMGVNGGVVPSAPPPPPVFYPAPMLSPYGMVTDKLHICPEFMMDQCNVLLCPFVHPGELCVCVHVCARVCVHVCMHGCVDGCICVCIFLKVPNLPTVYAVCG